MKPASLKEIRTDLKHRSHSELMELCLRLARFKKENKELLTYLLFESSNEEAFVQSVKEHIEIGLEDANTKSFYYIKKTVRKVLRETKKFIRYSGKKETEVELLLYFCSCLKNFRPSITQDKALTNLYIRQINFIEKKLDALHEDLQYDFGQELEKLALS